MSPPLYTHPSLAPGILLPVPSGNGETAPVDGAEFRLRPSPSSALSPPCCCSHHHHPCFNVGENAAVTNGSKQPAVYEHCPCELENIIQQSANSRRNSELAPVIESALEKVTMRQDTQQVSQENNSLPSLDAAGFSSTQAKLQSQLQSECQIDIQACTDENNETHTTANSSPSDTQDNAISLKASAPTPSLSTQSSQHPQHRQWRCPSHSSYNLRKPGGSEYLTSVSNPPFQHSASQPTYTPDHIPDVNPGNNSTFKTDVFENPVPGKERYMRYPTMNTSSALLNRRPNAREQVMPLDKTNGNAHREELQPQYKDRLNVAPSSPTSISHARYPSVPNAIQQRRASDFVLNGYNDRRNSASRMPLQSPCFFHQRFENAVNISQILSEIEADDWISHSRLVATATSVREVSRQLQRRQMKMEVKSVLIVTKARDNRLVYLTRELAEWLMSTPRYNNGRGNGLGVTVYVDAKLQKSKRFDAPGLIAKNPAFADMLKFWTIDMCWACPEKFDLVLTLGGDGTVLFTSWLFQRVVPPVLSFSLGSLGFLTHFEFSRYKEHLNRVMGETGMRVNLRMRFTCTVFRVDRRTGEEREDEQFEVVNELVIDRGPSPWVSNLELYGDGELLTVVQADGCIFSTPTGSTAYSLSAGGSLVHPSIPAILLTPICPHTLSFRPMVLSDSVSLKIAVPLHSRSTAYCSFDGKSRTELRQGDYVTVEASQYPFPTVVSGQGEWFDSVRRALRWNTRGAVQRGWGTSCNEDQMDSGDINIGPNMGCEGIEHEEEQWDIDTDSNSDIMHYETMPFSRRSQLLSRSATTSNSTSTSTFNTPPEGTIYSESNKSSRDASGLSLAVKEHNHQTVPSKINQDNPEEILKIKSLSLADDAGSGYSSRGSLNEQWDRDM